MSPRKNILLLKHFLNMLVKNEIDVPRPKEKRPWEFELSEISEILKGQLFLSGCRVVTKEALDALGIKAVVRAITKEEETIMADSTKGATVLPQDVRTFYVRILDNEQNDIQAHFEEVSDFINAQLKAGNKVLVHCGAGVSRSAALVIAYLIRNKRYNLRQAYALVKEKRKIVRPNNGFFRQLIEYERTSRDDGRASVRMILTPNGVSMPDIVYENAIMAKLR